MFGRKHVRVNQVSSGGDYSRQIQIGMFAPGNGVCMEDGFPLDALPERLFNMKTGFVQAGFTEEQAFLLIRDVVRHVIKSE